MPPIRNQRPTNVRYYAANRDQERQRIFARQRARSDMVRTLKARPCADCGLQFAPHQMDFDHRDPASKSFVLAAGRVGLMNERRVLAEVAKCDVVCANCHRTRTRRQHQDRLAARGPSQARSPRIAELRRKWRRDAAFLDALRNVPCTDCGGRFPPWSMEFDHRDPATKRFEVTRIVGKIGATTMARVLAEIDRCDIVCTNCHRDRTFRRRHSVAGDLRE
jgi:predicted Zn-ribbon and HTH transcriptional regulator